MLRDDVDLAVDDDQQARLGGVELVMLAGRECHAREAAGDPRDLVGPQMLEDRQPTEHRFEIRHAGTVSRGHGSQSVAGVCRVTRYRS